MCKSKISSWFVEFSEIHWRLHSNPNTEIAVVLSIITLARSLAARYFTSTWDMLLYLRRTKTFRKIGNDTAKLGP